MPEQDVVDGIVIIQIVESIFGEVQFEEQAGARVSISKIEEIIHAHQQPGQPLNADAIDRALLLAGDRPDATVSGNLREGRQPRTTDLLVKAGDKPLVSGTAATDNNGARSTGSERLTSVITLGSPMELGELVTANVIHTQGPEHALGDGSDYGRLAISVPVGLDGLTVGVSGSYLAYSLISPQFVALHANGTSATLGADSSYPLIRSRMRNLYINANYDHKFFDNYSQGAVSSRYTDDVASMGVSGNLFDSIGGGGANAASLTLTSGYLNLDGSPTSSSDASTARTAGTYGKLRFSLSRQQTITEELSLFGSFSGQRATKNLDSSEKFYLGGGDGVRAFPVNEAGGSDADMVNIELRQQLTGGLVLTGFFDYGWIAQNHNNDISGAASPNAYSLKGAGLALAWQTDFGPTFRATWAHRIGGNPNPSSTGNDQDGSLTLDRLWLSASMPF